MISKVKCQIFLLTRSKMLICGVWTLGSISDLIWLIYWCKWMKIYEFEELILFAAVVIGGWNALRSVQDWCWRDWGEDGSGWGQRLRGGGKKLKLRVRSKAWLSLSHNPQPAELKGSDVSELQRLRWDWNSEWDWIWGLTLSSPSFKVRASSWLVSNRKP